METAQGILSVVTANMAKAIRVISVQRGHDPRSYALMAFGGAGPLHAARLARELEMPRVLVPANPGILCAMGLLLTDLRADFAVTKLLPAEDSAAAGLAEGFAALGAQAERWFEQEGIAAAERRLIRTVDMRYHGQNYELGIAVPDGATMATLIALFADAHRQRYGFATDEDPVEIVTLRLEANGMVRKANLKAHPEAGPDASGAIAHHREVWLPESGGFRSTPIYARQRLRPGNRFAGPAIVEQMDATTLVPPGMTARVDRWLNLILEAA
jgi:N-methylhydantoinase A